MADPWSQFQDATPAAARADPWSQFNDASPPQGVAPGSTLSDEQRNPLPLVKSRIEMGARQGENTAGMAQGALDVYRSVVDQPAAWLEKHIGQLPGPSAQATNAQDAGVAANLDKQMGNGMMPAAMRLTGNAAFSAPLMLAPNLGPGALNRMLTGALQGGQAAAMTNAGSDRPLGEQMATGAALGGAIPLAGDAMRGVGRSVARRLLPVGDVNPEVANLAARSEELGVPIRPGQMSGSPTVKVFDDQLSRMPGTGYTPDNPMRISPNAQHEAFSRAVARTFGEDAPALTQDVMADAHNRITGVMNEVIERNSVAADHPLAGGLIEIRNQAEEAMGPDAAPVMRAVDQIAQRMANGEGQLTGRQYQNWRQRGGLLSNLTENQNPTIAHYGQRIRNTLDDAFQRQAQGQDGQLLAHARAQYRNLKTVEPLAAKAPTGRISPALLLGAVRSEFPNMARAGAGDLGDLGRIGQAFLKDPPNSTTAERSLLLSVLSNPLKAGAHIASLPLTATLGRGMNSAINSHAYLERLLGVAPAPPNLGPPSGLPPLLLAPSINRLLPSLR